MKKFLSGLGRVLKPVALWSLRIVGWILWPLWWVLSHKPLRPVVELLGGGGSWRRVPGFTHRMADHLGLVYVISISVNAAAYACGLRSWLGLVVTAPMLSVVMAALSHRDYLCIRCAEESPINPAEAAEHHREDLRRFHKRMFPTLLVYLLVSLVVSIVGQHWLAGYALYVIGIAAVFTLFLPAYRWIQMHRRYEAWCPWCHPGRDDDDDEFEPVDPDPHGIKEPVS